MNWIWAPFVAAQSVASVYAGLKMNTIPAEWSGMELCKIVADVVSAHLHNDIARIETVRVCNTRIRPLSLSLCVCVCL